MQKLFKDRVNRKTGLEGNVCRAKNILGNNMIKHHQNDRYNGMFGYSCFRQIHYNDLTVFSISLYLLRECPRRFFFVSSSNQGRPKHRKQAFLGAFY